jgi:hypothetical protein
MTQPKTPKSPQSAAKPDSLVKSGKGADVEITETDLKNVTGGAQVDYFLKIDGVKGETLDDKH